MLGFECSKTNSSPNSSRVLLVAKNVGNEKGGGVNLFIHC